MRSGSGSGSGWADKREGKEGGGTEERETSAAAAAAAQSSSPLQIVVGVVLVEETDTKRLCEAGRLQLKKGDKDKKMSSELGKSAAVTLENISAAIAGTGLMDLIKVVRACKTAAEERAVIARESAELRQCFREDGENHYRNMVKVRTYIDHTMHIFSISYVYIRMNARKCTHMHKYIYIYIYIRTHTQAAIVLYILTVLFVDNENKK